MLWARSLSLAAVLVLGGATPTVADERSCLGAICVEASDEGDTVTFHAINGSPAPVAVQIQVQTKGLQPYPMLPEIQLVPAGGLRRIAQYVPSSPDAGWSYRYAWSWIVGDPTAKHNDRHRYRMPFGGREQRKLSQGNDEPFTHNGEHRYAFDFAMPIGTPILAARSGTVILVNDGYAKNGLSNDYLSKANAIYILHDDRTIGIYAHLDAGSGVRQGMVVRVGDLIGFSGNTGFSSGPHLHFAVWKPDAQNHAQTLPIRFEGGPNGYVPRTGDTIAPSCHEDGIPCPASARMDEGSHPDRRHVQRSEDGTCRCSNGSVITTHLPCRMVCPRK